jgi:hypothetical protein
MPKFIITVDFDGEGVYTVKAKSKKEAEQKWLDGEYESYEDSPNNYANEVITRIEKE